MKQNYSKHFELASLAEKEGISFVTSGHFHGYQIEDIRIFTLTMDTPHKNIREIIHAIQKKKDVEPILLGSSCLVTCPECGVAPEFYYYKGAFQADPCAYPNGLPAFSFELNIPSGKIVVANDLRGAFPITGSYYVNYTINEMRTTLAYAKLGMAHGFVGNTCPAFQAKGDQNFYITNGNPIKGLRTKCRICTDLWWYSLCDFDELARRKPEWIKSEDLDIVKCRPGVYKITHQYHTIRANRDKGVYATIEWIREPDPVVDLQKIEREKNLTAGQVIADGLARYPERTKSKTDAILRKADHILCTIGNGYDFHPNGWFGSNPDLQSDSPSVKIPRFHGKRRWYPLCDYSAIAGAAGLGDKKAHYTLNESFANLAFNIVACMLIYGMEGSGQPGLTTQQKKKIEQNQLRWAWHIYLGLKTRYPQWIPAYAKELPKPKFQGINIPPK